MYFAPILVGVITIVAGYKINHLMDALNELTEKNIALNSQQSILDLKNSEAHKIVETSGKSKATKKAL
jgi:hypothetical protein